MIKLTKYFTALVAAISLLPTVTACSDSDGGSGEGDGYTGGPARFNVASYNIRLEATDDYNSGNGWTRRMPAMAELIKFHGFDIFGTQEGFKRQLDALVRELPGYKYIGVGRDDGTVNGEFAAVFYNADKFEVLTMGNFWLSETPNVPGKGWDAGYPRVCTWARFRHKTSGQKFAFFNLHMDHIGQTARLESPAMILQQVTALRAGLPVILTGDFNCEQESEPYKRLLNGGMFTDAHDAADIAYAPNGTWVAYDPEHYTTDRIDHIFVTKGIKTHTFGVLTDTYHSAEENNARARIPSDHYPILANVEIEPLTPADESVINVGTYNLHHDTAADIAAGNGWSDRKTDIADQIRFHGYDIVGTQEAGKAALGELVSLMPGYDMLAAYSDGNDAGHGSAIIYRKSVLDVVDNGSFYLSETPDVPGKGWDDTESRVCCWARLCHKATAREFIFATVQTGAGDNASNESVKLLKSKLGTIAAGLPVILGGSFGFNQSQAPYGFLADGMQFADAYSTASMAYAPNGTVSNFTTAYYSEDRYDYVLVSPSLDVTRYGVLVDAHFNSSDTKKARTPSSHYPVIATAKL